jgi:hypothetical protein
MSIIEILLMCSIGLSCYFFILIKNTLRGKGHKVAYLYGWGSDFYKFRELIEKETDHKQKVKFMSILYGLYASIALLVIVAVIGVILK